MLFLDTGILHVTCLYCLLVVHCVLSSGIIKETMNEWMNWYSTYVLILYPPTPADHVNFIMNLLLNLSTLIRSWFSLIRYGNRRGAQACFSMSMHDPNFTSTFAYNERINEWMKKALRGRGKHCALAAVRQSQKFSPRRGPPSRGRAAGRPKFNQLEMVTTFTYRPSLVKIDARNFELSW